MDYFYNLWITWNDALKKYYEVPEFLFDTIKFDDAFLSFLSEDSHEDAREFATQQKMESYFCVTHGEELFRLVSPVFKQNMYSGVREELKSTQSPVNLFYDPLDELLGAFPLLEVAQVFQTTVTAGDCLFVPAWWWVQSSTEKEETMMLEMEFEVHSQFYDLINSGFEKEMILHSENTLKESQARIMKTNVAAPSAARKPSANK